MESTFLKSYSWKRISECQAFLDHVKPKPRKRQIVLQGTFKVGHVGWIKTSYHLLEGVLLKDTLFMFHGGMESFFSVLTLDFH